MEFLKVTSTANPSVKFAKKLAEHPRVSRKEGFSLCEGIHLARELINRKELITKVFFREGALRNSEVAEAVSFYSHSEIPCLELPAGIFSSICPVEASTGIICMIKIPEEGKILSDEDVVYLDGVQDPGNVGTIIRLSLASGISNIALSPQCAYVWSPKVLRAGMGAHFYCNIVSAAELAEVKSASRAFCLVADARGGKDLYTENWGHKASLWVFGSEGLGVSQKALELSDKTLLIPLDKRVESLNVATAAAVCLFEQKRRRLMKKIGKPEF